MPRTPDAIRCPWDWPCADPSLRGVKLRIEFGKLWPSGQAWKSEVMGSSPKTAFIRGDANDTILFPHGHELAGQPRYDWFLGKKIGGAWVPVAPAKGLPGEEHAILLGYLREEAHAPEVDLKSQALAELDAHIAASATDSDFQAQLAKLGLNPSGATHGATG